MQKSILLLMSYAVLSSCTINLGDTAPPKKTEEEIVNDLCKQGDKQACALADQIQKKKEEKYQKIIKDSGLRNK